MDFCKYSLLVIFLAIFSGCRNNQIENQNKMESLKWNICDIDVLDIVNSGDLNLDGINDLVLILKNRKESFGNEMLRPMIIFIKKKNSYVFFERNDSVIMDKSCGGMYGDCYNRTVIKNGCVSIEHYGGSGNNKWLLNTTFKWDKKRNTLMLHKISEAGSVTLGIDPDADADSYIDTSDFRRVSFKEYSSRLIEKDNIWANAKMARHSEKKQNEE